MQNADELADEASEAPDTPTEPQDEEKQQRKNQATNDRCIVYAVRSCDEERSLHTTDTDDSDSGNRDASPNKLSTCRSAQKIARRDTLSSRFFRAVSLPSIQENPFQEKDTLENSDVSAASPLTRTVEDVLIKSKVQSNTPLRSDYRSIVCALPARSHRTPPFRPTVYSTSSEVEASRPSRRWQNARSSSESSLDDEEGTRGLERRGGRGRETDPSTIDQFFDKSLNRQTIMEEALRPRDTLDSSITSTTDNLVADNSIHGAHIVHSLEESGSLVRTDAFYLMPNEACVSPIMASSTSGASALRPGSHGLIQLVAERLGGMATVVLIGTVHNMVENITRSVFCNRLGGKGTDIRGVSQTQIEKSLPELVHVHETRSNITESLLGSSNGSSTLDLPFKASSLSTSLGKESELPLPVLRTFRSNSGDSSSSVLSSSTSSSFQLEVDVEVPSTIANIIEDEWRTCAPIRDRDRLRVPREPQNRKEQPTQFSRIGRGRDSRLPSSGSCCCRICQNSASLERLISPCNCKGSLAYVHVSCLERWLNQSGRSSCELCQFQYNVVQTLRYSLCESLRIWFRHPYNRRHLLSDVLIALILTIVTVGLFSLAIAGMTYFVQEATKYGIPSFTAECTLTLFLVFISMGYAVTIYILSRDQVNPWLRWWRINVDIRLNVPRFDHNRH